MTEQNVQNFSFEEQGDTIIATGLGVIAATVIMKMVSWGTKSIVKAVTGKKQAKAVQATCEDESEE